MNTRQLVTSERRKPEVIYGSEHASNRSARKIDSSLQYCLRHSDATVTTRAYTGDFPNLESID